MSSLYALCRSRNPRFHLRFLPWPPTADWGAIITACAVEGCGHRDRGVHLFCPPPWGKQDMGMRTDGLREEAALSLLCGSGLVSQNFPLCLEEGLLAGLFTPESTPSLLHSDGFSSALSKCVLHFSLPAFCWPCSPARSSQPSISTLVFQPVLWARVELTWKTKGSPSNTSFSCPLLRVGPELAVFLKVVSVLVFIELFVRESSLPLAPPWALPASTGI